MNIRLTIEASAQLDMMRFTRTPQAGFIVGDCIGAFEIVNLLVPASLEAKELQRHYVKALELYGSRLLGVFFIGCEPFADHWFGEDLVLAADENRLQYFMCEASAEGARLVPIIHWEE